MNLTTTQLDDYRQAIQPLKTLKGPLLSALHEAQNRFGYIPVPIMEIIQEELHVSNAHIHGVVSFYELFHRLPRGRHVIGVCRGTACHIDGSKTLRELLESTLAIKEGESTIDNRFTIIPIKCLGLCDQAPSMIVDHDTYERVTAEQLPEI